MKIIVVLIIVFLASGLIFDESYGGYLESALETCETLYNRPNAPFPSYDPEKYQECVEKARSEQQGMDSRVWVLGGGILAIIIIVFIFSMRKKTSTTTITQSSYTYSSTRKGWTEVEKEQVRIRQDGKCAKCDKPPPRWEYHHIDGNRTNNDLSNCEGLCPNCHSVKTHDSEHF